MRFELFTTKDGSLGISFWETFLAFCFGIMLLIDICVVNIPGNLRRVQIPYHIFCLFLPSSLSHLIITLAPPPSKLSLYITIVSLRFDILLCILLHF